MFSFSRENTSLFAKWWRNIDKEIFFSFVILFLLGLFFSFSSTSYVVAEKMNKETYFFFVKHFVFVSISLFLIFIISIQEKDKLIKFLPFLFIFSIIILALVPILGVEIKGSKRWLDFLFFPRFQPIEILKPFTIVFLATILCSEKNDKLYYKYFLSFLAILPIIYLLITQPDIGQTFLIFMTWLSLIFISGINLLIFFLFFSIILLGLLYLIIFFEKFNYILIRLKSFIDPYSGNNYQSEKASEAIINGGFFGKGIGEGVLKNRVPEAHTDYIVSVISEEFGAIIIIVLMLIFLFFAYQVFKKLYYEKNNKIRLILVGSISLILLQTLIHIGVNIRLFPTTGMTLPYLSYGGSSIVGTSILSGIILNLTKRKIY